VDRALATLAHIPCRSAVLNAELCLLADDGVPSFAGLQSAFSSRRRDELVVYAFDLLHRDGAESTHGRSRGLWNQFETGRVMARQIVIRFDFGTDRKPDFHRVLNF
jgi:ATP-dependent DNA ligase